MGDPPPCNECGDPAIYQRPRRVRRGRSCVRALVPMCDGCARDFDDYRTEQNT